MLIFSTEYNKKAKILNLVVSLQVQFKTKFLTGLLLLSFHY